MAEKDRALKRWLLVTGVGYAAGAIDFVLRPRAATGTLNQVGGQPIAPEEPPGLYNALAASYMATIAALALTAAEDPDANRNLIPPLLVAKAASSAALLYRYVRTRRRGFAGRAALDALLLGITGGLYAGRGEA
jgi:hypothetical protein